MAEPDNKSAVTDGAPPAKRKANPPSWVVPVTHSDRWRGAMIARAVLMTLGALGLIVHTVAPDLVQVDGEGLALLGVLFVMALVPVLKDFTLPGGGGGSFVDGVNEAAAAQERSESDRSEEAIDTTALEVFDMANDLTDVEQLAGVVPHEAVVALRHEMSDRLRQLDIALVGGHVPASDYEVVRRLVKHGIVDQELAAAAYAVLGATERGAREREVPVDAVQELIGIADRLLKDLAHSANPGLQFEKHVRDVLYEMAGRDRVIEDPSKKADFRVHNTFVEAKWVRPGSPAEALAARAARQLAERLGSGARGILVITDEGGLERRELDGILVTPLKDLRPEDLQLP